MSYEGYLIMKKIGSTPFDAEKEAENIISKKFPAYKEAGQFWGNAIEEHVLNIVNTCDNVKQIYKGKLDDFPISSRSQSAESLQAHERTNVDEDESICKEENRRGDNMIIDSLCPESKYPLYYNTNRERFFLRNETGIYNEIDLLLKVNDDIIFGEVKYLNMHGCRISRRKSSPLNQKNFKDKLDRLEKFFSCPVEYWAIMNHDYIASIKKRKNDPSNIYKNFIQSGCNLVSVKVDEEVRKKFYRLLHEKCPDIIFSDIDKNTYLSDY